MSMDAELEREFGHINRRLDDFVTSFTRASSSIEAQIKSLVASIQSNNQTMEKRISTVEAELAELRRGETRTENAFDGVKAVMDNNHKEVLGRVNKLASDLFNSEHGRIVKLERLHEQSKGVVWLVRIAVVCLGVLEGLHLFGLGGH